MGLEFGKIRKVAAAAIAVTVTLMEAPVMARRFSLDVMDFPPFEVSTVPMRVGSRPHGGVS